MIYHPLLSLLTTILNSLYATLPPFGFTFQVGQGQTLPAGVTSDNGAVEWFCGMIHSLDRFFPLHDALIPILAASCSITVGMLAFKAVKFVLSLIPTVSASG